MSTEQPTVAGIFRRAQEIKRANPKLTYKELQTRIVDEYQGAPFPPVYNLAIPEQDGRAPEEDWSAGLPLVLRGIQQQDWKDIANGIALSLEQTDNYEAARGGDGTTDEWHNRSIGIEEPTEKAVGKWMPSDLMDLAERQSKK